MRLIDGHSRYMVMKGHSPEGLKMLIKTELINGNYKVASKYISLLEKTLFYRNEAKTFEKLLFNDQAVKTDPELGGKKQNRLESDFFSITDDPYINIERILATDSLNRKAFEYKLAFMLLKKNTQGIVDMLPEFDRYGYRNLPVPVEEAIVSFSALNRKRILIPENIEINRNTVLRWNQFFAVFQQYGNDPKKAEPALKKQFGNTFWYYVIYR